MNCLECNKKWFLTEDTRSCYNEIIDNYYLDNNILRKCNKYCLHCTINENNDNYMNCTKCINNFYMTEDSQSCYEEGINNYYFDNNDKILKKSNKNCLK